MSLDRSISLSNWVAMMRVLSRQLKYLMLMPEMNAQWELQITPTTTDANHHTHCPSLSRKHCECFDPHRPKSIWPITPAIPHSSEITLNALTHTDRSRCKCHIHCTLFHALTSSTTAGSIGQVSPPPVLTLRKYALETKELDFLSRYFRIV